MPADSYRQASFRGVPFFVRSATHTASRRVNVHEYPDSEYVEYQDNGRLVRVHKLSGYVLGDDAQTQRDTLELALEQPGAGDLMHPNRGPKRVRVMGWSAKESSDSWRQVSFSLTFEEDLASELTYETVAPANSLVAAADAGAVAAAEDFTEVYDPQGFTAIEQAKAGMDSLYVFLADTQGVAMRAESYRRMLSTARGALDATILNAESLASTLSNLLLFGVSPQDASAENATEQSGQLKNVTATSSGEGVSTVEQQQIDDLTTSVVLSARLSLLVSSTYTSAQEFRGAQEELLDDINALSAQAFIGFDLFNALQQMRAALWAYADSQLDKLPSIVTYTLEREESTITLLYQLLGSLDTEADFVARNNITHPAFLPPGDYELLV